MQNTTIFTAEQYLQGLTALFSLDRNAFERLTEITWSDFDEEYQGGRSDEEAAKYIAELQTDTYIDNADPETQEAWSTYLRSSLLNALQRPVLNACRSRYA